ncbi:MAG: hypothetical protein RL150_160 [Candidatus Parcubacteria bacterium]|jgi:ATP-binding cassette subfamily B protein
MEHTQTHALHPLRFLWNSCKPSRRVAIYASLAVLGAAAIEALIPYFLKHTIDALTVMDGSTARSVLLWLAVSVVAIFISDACWRISGYFGGTWITQTEGRSYKKLFDYLSKHSQTFFDNRFAGSLVGSVNTAADSGSSLIELYLWNYLNRIISIILSAVLIFSTNGLVGALFIVWVILLIPLNYKLAKKRAALAATETSLQQSLRGSAIDIISNISIVHQFARSNEERVAVGESVDNFQAASKASWIYSEVINIVNNILSACFIAATAGILFMQWQQGNVTAGEFIMVISLLTMTANMLQYIGHSMNRYARNYGEMKESLEALLLPHSIADLHTARDLVVSEGAIAFEDVSFHYNESRSVLEKLSVQIKPGERVGIVGPSGAGKTTLVRLLLRQHEPTDGTITIDRQDIGLVTLDSLRSAIGTVPQEPLLFHRTIKENILYGKPDATDEEVIRAATLAQAHDFIITCPETYDTIVGERGIKLSAGQRQRIAIARAILKNAPILVLDEATSALDSESEVAIQDALGELMKGKTVLAIAHRLSTLREMDRIIVLKDGAIAEDGSHHKLIRKPGGIYATLWKHQAGGFIVEEDERAL